MRSGGDERRGDAGSMTLSILGWIVVALLVGASTTGLLLWAFGWPSLPRSAAFTARESVELLKIVLAVVAGFGGVVLLSVNHRKQKVAEGDHRLALRQEDREKSKLLNERFATAAEQLAHERAQVRLAGVYALAGLADDWDEGRQKCVELLIAYLRLSGAPGSDEEEVVDTIFRMFRERLTSESAWSTVDYDFAGMKLIDADFSGFRFLGTVTFDHVVFSGEATSFTGTRFVGPLRCYGTEFTAEVTDFRDAWFRGAAEFQGARFTTKVDLTGAFVFGGEVEFNGCVFNGPVIAQELVVSPGVLRVATCVFRDAAVDFRYGQFGDMFDAVNWVNVLLGRSNDPARGRLYVEDCSLVDSRFTMDDVVLLNGRVVIRDIVLRGGELRIRPAEMRRPSLEVRRIVVRDGQVDVPVPDRIWQGRAAGDGTPQPSEGDGHGRVGQDRADVGEEL